MSIGGATVQPTFMKAEINPAAPLKISKKHMTPSERIEEISAIQMTGQEGLSCENFKELNEPLRISSIETTSAGLERAVTAWLSVPESSDSEKSARRTSTPGT